MELLRALASDWRATFPLPENESLWFCRRPFHSRCGGRSFGMTLSVVFELQSFSHSVSNNWPPGDHGASVLSESRPESAHQLTICVFLVFEFPLGAKWPVRKVQKGDKHRHQKVFLFLKRGGVTRFSFTALTMVSQNKNKLFKIYSIFGVVQIKIDLEKIAA